jgi:hypothetical protein
MASLLSDIATSSPQSNLSFTPLGTRTYYSYDSEDAKSHKKEKRRGTRRDNRSEKEKQEARQKINYLDFVTRRF